MARNEDRAPSTPELNKLKARLIGHAYKRVKRARSSGFHIEAIAILESLMTDRLESLIVRATNEQIKTGNLVPALKKVSELDLISEDFEIEIRLWSRQRAKIVHEMVKVTVVTDSEWSERMKFAKMTSAEGFRLLTVIDSIVKKYKPKLN